MNTGVVEQTITHWNANENSWRWKYQHARAKYCERTQRNTFMDRVNVSSTLNMLNVGVCICVGGDMKVRLQLILIFQREYDLQRRQQR